MSSPEPARPAARRDEVVQVLRFLDEWGTARQWTGSDPYEGLNAQRFATTLKRTPVGRRILVQAVKRSPVDLRPLFGIPRGRNSAAIAHVVSSYAFGDFLPEDVIRGRLRDAVEMLLDLRIRHFEESCWSYHWDLETRVFFYPKTEPNTIATAFAGMALLDAYERIGDAALLEHAASAGEFFIRHVPQTTRDRGAFFGYVAGDRTPIHNASMLVCELLARLSTHVDREDFRAAVRDGILYTAAHQRPDGSWPYGELSNLGWVDSFHTGYVLSSLLACHNAGFDVSPILEQGLDYYRRELFLDDGTPKYFSTSLYPIDAQNVAQGIQTFALAGEIDGSYGSFAWTVYDFAMRNMRRTDGAFLFQRRRFWSNPASHVRWVMAPMLLALTHLSRTESAGAAGEGESSGRSASI